MEHVKTSHERNLPGTSYERECDYAALQHPSKPRSSGLLHPPSGQQCETESVSSDTEKDTVPKSGRESHEERDNSDVEYLGENKGHNVDSRKDYEKKMIDPEYSSEVLPNRGSCRFFSRGYCKWGNSCRYLHLNHHEELNNSMLYPEVVTPPPMEWPGLVPEMGMWPGPEEAVVHHPYGFSFTTPNIIPYPASPFLPPTFLSGLNWDLWREGPITENGTSDENREPIFGKKRQNMNFGERCNIPEELHRVGGLFESSPYRRPSHLSNLYDNGPNNDAQRVLYKNMGFREEWLPETRAESIRGDDWSNPWWKSKGLHRSRSHNSEVTSYTSSRSSRKGSKRKSHRKKMVSPAHKTAAPTCLYDRRQRRSRSRISGKLYGSPKRLRSSGTYNRSYSDSSSSTRSLKKKSLYVKNMALPSDKSWQSAASRNYSCSRNRTGNSALRHESGYSRHRSISESPLPSRKRSYTRNHSSSSVSRDGEGKEKTRGYQNYSKTNGYLHRKTRQRDERSCSKTRQRDERSCSKTRQRDERSCSKTLSASGCGVECSDCRRRSKADRSRYRSRSGIPSYSDSMFSPRWTERITPDRNTESALRKTPRTSFPYVGRQCSHKSNSRCTNDHAKYSASPSRFGHTGSRSSVKPSKSPTHSRRSSLVCVSLGERRDISDKTIYEGRANKRESPYESPRHLRSEEQPDLWRKTKPLRRSRSRISSRSVDIPSYTLGTSLRRSTKDKPLDSRSAASSVRKASSTSQHSRRGRSRHRHISSHRRTSPHSRYESASPSCPQCLQRAARAIKRERLRKILATLQPTQDPGETRSVKDTPQKTKLTSEPAYSINDFPRHLWKENLMSKKVIKNIRGSKSVPSTNQINSSEKRLSHRNSSACSCSDGEAPKTSSPKELPDKRARMSLRQKALGSLSCEKIRALLSSPKATCSKSHSASRISSPSTSISVSPSKKSSASVTSSDGSKVPQSPINSKLPHPAPELRVLTASPSRKTKVPRPSEAQGSSKPGLPSRDIELLPHQEARTSRPFPGPPSGQRVRISKLAHPPPPEARDLAASPSGKTKDPRPAEAQGSLKPGLPSREIELLPHQEARTSRPFPGPPLGQRVRISKLPHPPPEVRVVTASPSRKTKDPRPPEAQGSSNPGLPSRAIELLPHQEARTCSRPFPRPPASQRIHPPHVTKRMVIFVSPSFNNRFSISCDALGNSATPAETVEENRALSFIREKRTTGEFAQDADCSAAAPEKFKNVSPKKQQITATHPCTVSSPSSRSPGNEVQSSKWGHFLQGISKLLPSGAWRPVASGSQMYSGSTDKRSASFLNAVLEKRLNAIENEEN